MFNFKLLHKETTSFVSLLCVGVTNTPIKLFAFPKGNSFLFSDFEEVEYMPIRDFLNAPPFYPDAQTCVITHFCGMFYDFNQVLTLF